MRYWLRRIDGWWKILAALGQHTTVKKEGNMGSSWKFRTSIRYTVPLAVVVGFGLGAVTVQGLHAQAKPPVYYIAEIEVTNPDAYAKEYVPHAQALIKKSGGRLLAAGNKVTAFEGEPPKPRVAVQVWDSIEQIQAWRNSAEFKEYRQIGEKYAKFRAFAVEGVAQ